MLCGPQARAQPRSIPQTPFHFQQITLKHGSWTAAMINPDFNYRRVLWEELVALLSPCSKPSAAEGTSICLR